MKNLAESAHITIGDAGISGMNILPTLFFCRTGYFRCTVHFLPLDLAAMQIPLVIFHIDLSDFSLPVDIVLVDLPWIATAQPAGGTILTAAGSTVKRRPDNLLTFFFCCIFDQD